MLTAPVPGPSNCSPQRKVISAETIPAMTIPVAAERDIPYTRQGETDRCLDIYAPAAGGPYPVLVVVEDGTAETRAQAFAAQGTVFVNLPDPFLCVEDLANALTWIYINIADYGGDPYHLYLMGNCAGARLSALVATDGHYLNVHGLDIDILHGVILLNNALTKDEDVLYPIAQKPMPPFLVLRTAINNNGRILRFLKETTSLHNRLQPSVPGFVL